MRDRIAGVDFDERDGIVVAAVEGEIDSSNAADLRLALAERLPSAASALVLDLSAGQLRGQLGHPAALRPRPPARRPPAVDPPRRPGRGADAARARALRGRDRRADGSGAGRLAARARRRSRARRPVDRSRPRAAAAPPAQDARKRSIARPSRGSTSRPVSSTSPTRVANACRSSSSLRPIGLLTRAASAITPSRRPPLSIGAAIIAPPPTGSRPPPP